LSGATANRGLYTLDYSGAALPWHIKMILWKRNVEHYREMLEDARMTDDDKFCNTN
jgi:hypothetical protein